MSALAKLYAQQEKDREFCTDLLERLQEMSPSDFQASAEEKIESLCGWLERRPLTDKQRTMMFNIEAAVARWDENDSRQLSWLDGDYYK